MKKSFSNYFMGKSPLNKVDEKMVTTDTKGGKTIRTTSTPTSTGPDIFDKPSEEMYDEKVEVTKRGGKVKKTYDSKTGTKTKVKYDKEGNVKKTKARKTSKKRVQKLAKKSGTTAKTQRDHAKAITKS